MPWWWPDAVDYTRAMENSRPANQSEIVDQLISSYLTIPVQLRWRRAFGVPVPDRYEEAELEFAGLATALLPLERVIWRAAEVQLQPTLPVRMTLTGPSLEIVLGQVEVDKWQRRFQLPYRLELAQDGLIVHTELAGFPVAQFETRLEIEGGWFVLQPQRASLFGVPGYVSSLFRTYLPIPPLSRETKLAGIEHEKGRLKLRFALDDFEEEITPGVFGRIRKRFFPVLEQIATLVRSTQQNRRP